MALPIRNRLTAKEVATLFTSGIAVQTPSLALRYRATIESETRAAVMVPARVASQATERNRLRRRVLTALHAQFSQIRPGFIFAIVIKRAQLPTTPLIAQEVLTLLEKSGILNK